MVQLQQDVEQFLYRNAEHCDRQRWDDYLACFHPEASLHVPQWDSEHTLTTDPKREMSLIYYADRKGLEDRIFRLRTSRSAASSPMPRTLHLVTNVRIDAAVADSDEFSVHAKWVTHYYRFATAGVFFGEADYRLQRVGNDWQILAKRVVLLNDTINEVLDFYHV